MTDGAVQKYSEYDHHAPDITLENVHRSWDNLRGQCPIGRSDAYGGSLENRARLLVETLEVMRAAIGPAVPLGVRLKANVDISGFSATNQVILTALKRYGMFVADNGSDWFITGETNSAWNDSEINQLKQVPASAFEVVKLGTIQH